MPTWHRNWHFGEKKLLATYCVLYNVDAQGALCLLREQICSCQVAVAPIRCRCLRPVLRPVAPLRYDGCFAAGTDAPAAAARRTAQVVVRHPWRQMLTWAAAPERRSCGLGRRPLIAATASPPGPPRALLRRISDVKRSRCDWNVRSTATRAFYEGEGMGAVDPLKENSGSQCSP